MNESARSARRTALALLLPAVAAVAVARAATPPRGDDDLVGQIEAICRAAVGAQDVHGLSVAVAVGSDMLVADGWGYVEPSDHELADESSAYRAGSLTEPLIAISIVQLAQSERLSLDDTLGEHLGLEGEIGAVTLRQALTHTSGIPAYTDLVDGLPRRRAEELDGRTVLERMAALALEAEPGTCFDYSNTNVLALGLVLEKVTETSVPEWIRTRFVDPLDLLDTRYCYDGPPLREVADAAQEVVGSLVQGPRDWHAFDAIGLCSSARDLLELHRALVTGRVVSESEIARMTEPTPLADGSRTSFGMGFNLTPLDDVRGISYGGSTGGSRVHVAWYPGADLTIAVLSSSEAAPVALVERRIARAVLGLPDPDRAAVELPVEALATYVGDYYVGCNRFRIALLGDQLHVVPPRGEDFTLVALGEHRFVSAFDPEVTLEFHVESDRAYEFALDYHGATTVARRIE